MPFKSKKKRAAYMRKYRKQEKKRTTQLERAIKEGNLNLAKQLLNTKPSIDLFGKKPKRKKRKKR